jgi:hypothetical protein
MKRAILVALGIGTVITSAAALSIGTAAPKPVAAGQTEFEQARSAWTAREEMRTRVEARYLAARAQCEPLGGLKRDKCLISAHASKGHALMEIQAPYEMR